jgi:predicted amidohydrolase
MTDHLHLAVAQIHAIAGRPADNLARIERQATAAAIQGCDAILFAETTAHGYVFSPENLAEAEVAGRGPVTSAVIGLAMRLRLALLVGFIERAEDRRYNSHFCARPDGSWQVARKTALTPLERNAGLTCGDGQFRAFVLNGVPTAVVICADGAHPDLRSRLDAQGVRCCFCPTAGGDSLFGQRHRPIRAATLADPVVRAEYERLRAPVHVATATMDLGSLGRAFASANAMGDAGDGVHHLGHGLIVDGHGVVCAQIPGTPVIEHKTDRMTHALVRL